MSMKIYHGSQKLIERPAYGLGRPGNDFGRGFYCTENEELAKEWSVQPNLDGFANAYEISLKGLNILRLNSPEYTILNWIAILISNRKFRLKTPLSRSAADYLTSRFTVDVESYDVITGYRADDAYFDFAEAFLMNSISLEQLSAAMRLGKLGEQLVIKSEKAFKRLRFLYASPVSYKTYYVKKRTRTDKANKEFNDIQSTSDLDGLYLNVIIRERIGNEDERIPRNIAL